MQIKIVSENKSFIRGSDLGFDKKLYNFVIVILFLFFTQLCLRVCESSFIVFYNISHNYCKIKHYIFTWYNINLSIIISITWFTRFLCKKYNTVNKIYLHLMYKNRLRE